MFPQSNVMGSPYWTLVYGRGSESEARGKHRKYVQCVVQRRERFDDDGTLPEKISIAPSTTSLQLSGVGPSPLLATPSRDLISHRCATPLCARSSVRHAISQPALQLLCVRNNLFCIEVCSRVSTSWGANEMERYIHTHTHTQRLRVCLLKR